MRILSVSNCPLDPSQGSGYIIAGYAERLRQRGHTVRTLAPADYEWWRRVRGAKRLRTLLGYTAGTLRALRAENYDLVELWGAESWRVATRLSRRAVRPVTIGRSNGLEPHFAETLARHGLAARSGLAGRCFDRWQRWENAFRRVDALTTVSQFDRRYAVARGYRPEERLLTIENPLPDDWLGQSIATERLPIIGFFGGWLPNKGGELLAAALPDVLRQHPEWRVRLVGVGELAAERIFPADLASRAEIVPRVHDRARMKALYRETAVVAMPSAFDSFGLVGAEALACGCTLVASATGLAADLKPESEAVIVGERSPTAWSETLMALLGDRERQRRIAAGGYARVQSLRWDAATDRLVAFYEQMLATHARRN